MFPAYGGGGGGGGGRGGHHHSRRGGHGHGHGHQQYPVWENPPGRPSGFMIDRGDPSTSNQYYDGGGRRDGGGNRNHRGGGGHRNWDNRSQNNRGGGYQGEVVEIDSSDDDNVVEDAASNQQSHHSGRKRNRSRSSSHSRSRSNKKRKRKKSRSRDRNESAHSHHRNQRDDRSQSRHHHHNHRDRDYGDERVERDRRPHHQGRWDNNNRQPQDQFPSQQQLPPDFNFPLQQQMQGAMPLMSLMPNQQQLLPLMGMGVNPMVMNPMAMGILGALPFAIDNNPNIPNPFDQFQNMMNQQQQGFRSMQGEMDRPERVSRNADQHFFHAQEEQRLHVSQSFPKKVFLEEVNLHSDFAFRLDTSSNPIQMNHRSIPPQQKSSYDGGVNKGIFGATEDEISKVFNKFHTLRCKLPDNVSDSGSDESDCDEPVKKVKRDSAAKNFISLEKEDKKERRRRGDRVDFDDFERKDGSMSVRDRTEQYNKEVRNQPQNISLWIEFVQFQDKVWEDEAKQFEQDEPVWGKQGKRKMKSKKSLLEKKVAILEKALEKNPTNLQLHLLRLEYLLELYKPRHVLTEWKKLVTQYQQIVPFWIEYLLFSASQLMIFSTSTNASVFETCFQKFRLMMNPQYPEFQRPKKFPLFISDITFGLSLLLKNAGFMERAVSLHQAQLEFDFYCPKHLFKDESLLNWHEESGVFETFWGRGTPRFGEIGAKGWQNFDQDPITETFPVAVSDSSISGFEEEAFEDANERVGTTREKTERENADLSQKSNTWLNMESFRSKLYWLPWKTSSSDAEDCDDINRVVSAKDLKNFICPVPLEIHFISEFDRQAAYFRHLVSFLLTLREDFLPHTQTIELVCSPFLGIALTESLSLFNEIYYWRRLADLYVGTNNSEPESKAHHVFAPEGFKLADVVSANVTSEELKPAFFNLVLDTKSQDKEPTSTNADIESKKQSVLKANDGKFMEMFQRTVEAGIDLLDSEFSCTLFEMFLRFQQKLTCEQSSNIKQKIKFAKALMKKDKIRNSAGGYRELAMLEYFGNGNTEKAIDLLVRTTNATAKSLNLQDWDSVDWQKDWKTIVDLISLYRQLAELYLHQGDSIRDAKAYYTLVQLGNGFEALEPECIEMDEQNQWKPKSNVLLKAIRSYEKVIAMLIPNYRNEKQESTLEKSEKEESQFVDSEVYYKWNGDKCVEFLLQQRNLIVEWSCSFALFQFFTNGFDGASQVFENILGRLSKEQLNRREGYNPELIRIHIREQLYINWCNLAGRCLIKDPLMNSKFRSILRLALEEFPSSPPLLLLFTDVENQTSVAGKLWRLMMANMKQESDKIITHWPPLIMGIGLARKIEELEHDEEVGLPCFGLGGPAVPQDTIFYKLDSMLAVAEQHPGARHCPLLWRTHLKLLALRAREGKDVERAKATFYEAVRHCPSSKAIYLDGVTYFPELLQDVNDLLTEKQLLVRLPLQELDVHLELDDEEVGSGKNHKDSQSESQECVDDNDGSGDAKSQDKSQEDKSEGELGESD